MAGFNLNKFFGPTNLFNISGTAQSLGSMIDQTVGTSPQDHIDGVGAYLGRAIVGSSAANAQVITGKLDQVTNQLQGSLGQVGDQISQQISTGNQIASKISDSLALSNVISTVGFAGVFAGLMAVRSSVKENTAAVNQVGKVMAEKFNELIWLTQKQLEGTEKIYDILRHSLSNEAIQLLEQGEKNYSRGFYDEAIERFQKALAIDNTLYPLYRNLGMIYLHLNKYDEAESSFKKAQAFAEKDMEMTAILDLARYYWGKGDLNQASSLYEKGININSSPKLMYELSIIYADMGKSPEWQNLLFKAIEQDLSYWTLAAIDPDFTFIQKDVLKVLDDFYKLQYNAVLGISSKLVYEMNVCKAVFAAVLNDARKESIYNVCPNEIDQYIGNIAQIVLNKYHSNYRHVINTLLEGNISKIVSLIQSTDKLYLNLNNDINKSNDEITKIKATHFVDSKVKSNININQSAQNDIFKKKAKWNMYAIASLMLLILVIIISTLPDTPKLAALALAVFMGFTFIITLINARKNGSQIKDLKAKIPDLLDELPLFIQYQCDICKAIISRYLTNHKWEMVKVTKRTTLDRPISLMVNNQEYALIKEGNVMAYCFRCKKTDTMAGMYYCRKTDQYYHPSCLLSSKDL